MSKLRLLTMILAMPFVMLTMQGCEFAAGAATGAAANEALDDEYDLRSPVVEDDDGDA